MGYAKYYEDDKEVMEERFIEKNYYDYAIIKNDPPLYICNYCRKKFSDKNNLYNHIRKRHNMLDCIFIVNNQVISNEIYIEELKNLKIIRYDSQINIFINGTKINTSMNHIDGSSYEIDLTPYITNLLINNSIEINAGKKKAIIRMVSKQNINYKRIEEHIETWNKLAFNQKIGENIYLDDLSLLEKHCLDGFYNYFIGAVSKDFKDKKSRYEEAFGILFEFIDLLPKARYILEIIAFKFNWVDSLRKICINDDIFQDIYYFLTNQNMENIHFKEVDTSIYIENDLQKVMEIIEMIINKNYDEANKALNSYSNEFLYGLNDSNFKNKIYLLKARIALINNNKKLAKKMYNEIDELNFEKELKELKD